MKDAFGGIFNLVLIVIFLVVVMGILGLTVSYTKAFRAKNIIISKIEQYGHGGSCLRSDGACFKRIKEETDRIAYHPHNLNCPPNEGVTGWFAAPRDGGSEKLFCFYLHNIYKSTSGTDCGALIASDYYFNIITQVDIDIPIINKIMGLYFFQVKGDTRKINNTQCQKIIVPSGD